jgi:two-component SAPR family response regulator
MLYYAYFVNEFNKKKVMRLQEILQTTYETFLEQTAHGKLILLHPDSRYRSMLVAQIMNSSDFKSFYYAIGPDDVNLQFFLTSILNALANQQVTFGRHTNILPRYVLNNPTRYFDAVLDAFLKDLNELTDEDFVLVLDEYDRSDRADEVQRFIERISNHFPENGRLVINSRTLPRLPWVSMIAQGRAVVLKDHEVITESFYGITHTTHKDEGLEVYALGPSFVVMDNKTIENWEGHLPRLLFFFALDRPNVTRSEICDAFWPDLEDDQAVNVFHVTKRRLHKALDEDVLVHEDGYYRVNPSIPVYYDVMEFVDTLVRSRSITAEEERMEALRRVTDLYRGPFLHGHNERWIVDRREEFLDAYLEAMTTIATTQENNNQHDVAISTLQRATEQAPYRESLHREIMRLFKKLGRRSEIVGHYKKMKKLFKDNSHKISPKTSEYYQMLINDSPA